MKKKINVTLTVVFCVLKDAFWKVGGLNEIATFTFLPTQHNNHH